MFSRLFITALAVLPMMAALAAPTRDPPHHFQEHHEHHEHHEHYSGGSCNVGQLSCCNQVQSVSGNNNANGAGALLGLGANIPVLIGLDCDPIDILVGISGNNCAAQPVCCDGNAFPGVVNALNCSPLNVNV